MDSSKSSSKKTRRKVVNVRCRKISSNRSQLSFSRVAGAGFKKKLKTLSKNNRGLASALQEVRCDLENCKQDLNKMKCARIKVFEMHRNLLGFVQDFEEILYLLNTDESDRLLGPPSKPRRGFINKNNHPFDPVEEVTENESLNEEPSHENEPVTVHADNVNSDVTDLSINSAPIDQPSDVVVTPVLQLKDGTGLTSKRMDIDSVVSGLEDKEDSATPKLVLSSPFILKIAPEARIHLDLRDNTISTSENTPDVPADSTTTFLPVKFKSSKIPRVFNFNRPNKELQAQSVPEKEVENACASNVSESKLSNEVMASTSKFSDNSVKHNSIVIKNTNSAAKSCEKSSFDRMSFVKSSEACISGFDSLNNAHQLAEIENGNTNDAIHRYESNCSQRVTFEVPDTQIFDPVASDNCYEGSVPEKVSEESCANVVDIPEDAASRRKTFVVSKPKTLEENQNKEHNDRRKTFVKKSLKVDKTHPSKNRRGTFTISQKKDDEGESSNLAQNANFTVAQIENLVENVCRVDTEIIKPIQNQNNDNVIKVAVAKCSENCDSSARSANLPCEVVALQSSPSKTNSNKMSLSSTAENITYTETSYGDKQCAVEEQVAKETSSCELEDIIDKALRPFKNLAERPKSDFKKQTKNVSGNPSKDSFVVIDENLAKSAITLKNLEIRIQRNDMFVTKENSTEIKDTATSLNKLHEKPVNAENEVRIDDLCKGRKKSSNVKKSGLNKISVNSKDEIQSDSDDIQVLDDPKRKSIGGFRHKKRVSYKYFMSSSESENETLSGDDVDDDDILEINPPPKPIPIRGRISTSKCKKIFVFSAAKRKSILNKRRSKSKLSEVLAEDFTANNDKYNNMGENNSSPSTNPARISKTHRKSVTFAINAECKTNGSQVKVHENKARKSCIIQKEFQMSAISEENTEDIRGILKKTDNINDSCYSLELDASGSKENIHPKQMKHIISCPSEKNFDNPDVDEKMSKNTIKCSETVSAKKNKSMKNSKKDEKIRKRKTNKDYVDFSPNMSKKVKTSKKKSQAQPNKDIAISETKNLNVASDIVEDSSQSKVKCPAENDIPQKNTILVCAEIHPPPSFLQTEIPSKVKKRFPKTQKRLSVVLSDVFDSENIDTLNIFDREELLKNRTNTVLMTPLSENSCNVQPAVKYAKDAKSTINLDNCKDDVQPVVEDNVENKKSTVNLDNCEDVTGRRGRRKVVSYTEPKLNKKMRR